MEKKAYSRTSLSNVHTETQKTKRKMFVPSRSVCCLLPHVNVDAIADPIPGILLVPNVVLNSSFSRTNGKGYDNSRLSEGIHGGSRQIHDKKVTLYLSLM